MNGATTIYVYDAFGQLAAEYSTVAPSELGVRYYTLDAVLGSTRLITDANGNVRRRIDYAPFGEELPVGIRQLSCGSGCDVNAQYGGTLYPGPADFVNAKFTGKERDSETGLDYFGARYFSGAQGRFASSDQPFNDQHPADPQSWNLYGFVRNNSLRFVDPDGRACIWNNSKWEDDNSGGQSCSDVEKENQKLKPSATITDFEPPTPLLLAVAQGAQNASPVADPRFVAGFYGASVLGGTTYAAYGGVGGYTGLTTLGLKYSALGTASGAAFTAGQNANKFIVPLKHLANSAGRWAKFAQGVDPQQLIREALSSPNAQFFPNTENSGSFVVITNLGKTIGAKGETSVKVVVDWTGNIWTAYPKK